MISTNKNTKVFWDWFAKHEDYLLTINNDNHSSVLNRIGKALFLFSPEIYCNIAPTSKPEKFDVIFTTFGNPNAFEETKRLVTDAPEHLKEHWNLISLYPPNREHLSLQFTNTIVHTSNMYFQFVKLENDKHFLMTAIKGRNYNPLDLPKDFVVGIKTAVDSILGEENSSLLIEGIAFGSYEDLIEPIPLIDISDHIK